jgi:hypothetical protein
MTSKKVNGLFALGAAIGIVVALIAYLDSGQLATAPIIQPAIPDRPLRALNSE